MKRGINIGKNSHKFASILFLFILLIVTVLTQQESSGQGYGLRIEYGYEGKFGIYDIADTASAYLGNVLIAKAKAVKIIEKNSGPNLIEIEETHFNPSGDITYRGKLIFQFGFGGGHIVEEKAHLWREKISDINGWPAGY